MLQVAIDAIRRDERGWTPRRRGHPPAEQLRRYLSVFLRRVLNPEYETVHRLIQREIDHPTPAMDALVEQATRPRLEFLIGVVAELMECDPPIPASSTVGASARTIIWVRKNPIAERLGFVWPTPDNIDIAARHITDFSVAGIRAIAAQRPPSERAR